MVAAAIPTDRAHTKVCVTCLCERSIEEFRRRYRGTEKRHNQCRFCFNAYQRTRNEQRRSESLKRSVGRLARTTDPTSVEQAVSVLLHRFGGVEGFAHAIRESLDAAQRDGRHGDVLLYCQFVANLLVVAEEQKRQNEVPVDDMTEQELQEEFDEEMVRFLLRLSDGDFATLAECRGLGIVRLDKADGGGEA